MCQLHGSFLSITLAGLREPTSGPLTAPYGAHHCLSQAVMENSFTLRRMSYFTMNKSRYISQNLRNVN